MSDSMIKYIEVHLEEHIFDRELVTKGTYAKMARGEMVRYMAERQIEDLSDDKSFYFERIE